MTSASKWIWCSQSDPAAYNQTAFFQKEFKSDQNAKARLRIVADSRYRVYLNGKWLNDGPARAYPDHLQYDEIDITPALKQGLNRLKIIVRYFGVGTFHQIPQQAGLRAEIRLGDQTIGTDAGWLAAPAPAWKQWSPKVSIQMEPVEEYDARLETAPDWAPAIELGRQGKITPRNTGLLTKIPRRFKKDPQPMLIRKEPAHHCVPVTRLAHGSLIEADYYTSRPVILASVLTVRKKKQFDLSSASWCVAINGRLLKTGRITLPPGRHTALFFCTEFYGHQKEVPAPFYSLSHASWGTWDAFVAEDFLLHQDTRHWVWFEADNRPVNETRQRWLSEIEILSKVWKNATDPVPTLGKKIDRPAEQIFLNDFSAQFAARKPLRPAPRLLRNKTILPSSKGDVELCYDLGVQSCGYFDFSIQSEAGVIIDFHAVEQICPDGTVQHTMPINRNGLRYITKKGTNRFTSLKRRAGRYLFVTLRNQKSPVTIRSIRIIESTAPVTAVQPFRCSDSALNRIWDISERTLRLCMEDTFTDCPLYEQTLWIGDARNEALYAYTTYGNEDVSARGLELGAQSLEQFPMVGCQVPSSWDCLLPAWSFLWGIHVWEHYFYSGDKRLLRKLWPAVLKNLEGIESYMNRQGLFSARMWNLLDWAPIDRRSETVLHNSMLLVGALKAAEQCVEVLKDQPTHETLQRRRNRLIKAVNRCWDEQKNCYPDALDHEGRPKEKICQHTSMLALIHDIAGPSRRAAALKNVLKPPRGMTTVGSPFAMQFLYEALEKEKEFDALTDSIRSRFSPMLEAGASTVWEMFPGSSFDTGDFPTRSHCHAWSASPLYFLNRVILGIRQTEPGGKAFEISPWVNGLQYARGESATPRGPVSVDWKKIRQQLLIKITAPKGIRIQFVPNASHPEAKTVVQINRQSV